MVITGIKNGALLQRSCVTDECDIFLSGSFSGNPKTDLGTISKEDGLWRLTGIPIGGPYKVKIWDDNDSIEFSDIYVGDLWLLAGQSNMEGAGRLRQQDRDYANAPRKELRAFYMNDNWNPANAQLHQLWDSCDPAHQQTFEAERKNRDISPIKVNDFYPNEQVRGVGPGLFFIKKLFEETGVPQGVIPAAVGGAPISKWTPGDDEPNYYTAAIRRLCECGRNIRGIFWYQGEGYSGDLEDYDIRFISMLQGFTNICKKDVLPCVTAQVFKSVIKEHLLNKIQRGWSRFRAHQLDMTGKIPKFTVIATNDLELDDCIHLSADSQEILGKRAAKAMINLTNGKESDQPMVSEITAEPDSIIPSWMNLKIKYGNINGKLSSKGIPSGFTLSKENDEPTIAQFQHVSLEEDTVIIRLEMTKNELLKHSLWYAYGNGFYCNITDGDDRAIPAFGPLTLKDFIKE